MDRLDLVRRNAAEIIGEEELEELLKKKNPVAYIGTAPTGVPHVGYFIWGLKVADLLNAGFKVKVLLADLHAALDNTPWEVLEHRYNFYSEIIPLMIEAMGADTKNLEFVKGSSYQLSKEYVLDIFKMSSMTSVRDCHKAASEVVKMGDSPKLSGYIYPLMQALDEEYLKVDMQIGGIDQRKIFVLAREQLPKLGYKKRVEMMLPFLPGLVGEKMSSSVEASKISLLDDVKAIEKKINSADFIAGNSENGVMEFFKNVVFVLLGDRGTSLVIERPEKFGGNLEFASYEDLKRDVEGEKVHPLDIKNSAAAEIVKLLGGIEAKRKDLEELRELAYPQK